MLDILDPTKSSTNNSAFERLLRVQSAFGATFDASGRSIYYLSTASGVPGLWRSDLERGAGSTIPLVVGDERVQWAFAGPRAGRVIFGRDRGGNERTQLYVYDGDGLGASFRVLTDAPESIHYFGAWHDDGRSICYAANSRDARYTDIYVMDVESGTERRGFQADATQRAVAFRPGGRELLVQRIHEPFAHELLLMDLRDGRSRSLTGGAAAGRYSGAQWSPDGRTIYCVTDREGDFLAPVALDAAHGELRPLVSHDWDVEDLALSPDGRQLVYALNRAGYSELRLCNLMTGCERRLELPPGSLCYNVGRWAPTFSWSPNGRQLALTLTSATMTPDCWRLDPTHNQIERVSSSQQSNPPADLVEPELVNYPTFDGRQISAFVYRAPALQVDGSAPALVYVHGGPESQFRPSFNPIVQYFAQRGFVVVAPNVRGSSGYGRTFCHLDDVELRLDSVRDLAAGAAWIVASGLAHPRRIGLIGSSYGGYMVLAALTERPDLWAAGVDIVGIANFVTFLERTGPWRRRQREAEYGSLERDRALLERLSPIRRADQIAAPLLVVHGANDPRVPVSEAEQIVATLRALDRPVEYLRLEDEGHGLVKLHNRLDAYPKIAGFLERHLLVDARQ